MRDEQHWLADWIQEEGIRTLDQGKQALSDPQALLRLREKAERAEQAHRSPITGSGTTLLASRALDLSGILDCMHSECRRRQVDALFRKVWHYFDTVIIADESLQTTLDHWDHGCDLFINRLLSDMDLIMYLKDIGAFELIAFRIKPPPCEQHMEDHLKDAVLQYTISYQQDLIQELSEAARFSFTRQEEGSIFFKMGRPLFEHSQWDYVRTKHSRQRFSQRELKMAASQMVTKGYLGQLISDVLSSKFYASSLGNT